VIVYFELLVVDDFLVGFVETGVIMPTGIQYIAVEIFKFVVSNHIPVSLIFSFLCIIGLFNRNEMLDRWLFGFLAVSFLLATAVFMLFFNFFVFQVKHISGFWEHLQFDYSPFKFTP